MDGSRKSWISLVILIGVVYFVVGKVFTLPSLYEWRLVAWVVSAAVFSAHIAYEHFKLNNSPLATALHAAIAVAIGAFLLAAGATLLAMTVPSHAPYWQYLVALVAWPIFTAVPAFLVALAGATLLARLQMKSLTE